MLHWMKRVRAVIEDLLLANGLQLIETRGDNYLAITIDADGPAPAARALRFAALASRAVADLRSTRIRVGLACGHVTLATLQSMGEREVLCLFGDVVNVAGRLEQVSRCLEKNDGQPEQKTVSPFVESERASERAGEGVGIK